MWLGIDVMHIGELARLLTRPWFRDHTYAPEELAVAASFGPERAAEFLTGRFAAKEAVLKALGTGARAGLAFRQVAVLRTAEGAPHVRLDGPAARRARDLGMARVMVSITHKRGLVVAAAVGVAAEEAPPDGATADEIAARIAATAA